MKKTLTGITTLLLLLIAAGLYLTAAPPEDLYDQAAKLTSAYERKKLVREASVSEKLKLWNRQLDYALAHEDFTPEERALVIESRQYLTPSYFNSEIPKEFSDRVYTTFTIHPALYLDTFEIPGNSVVSDRKSCRPQEAKTTWGLVTTSQALGFAYSIIGLKKPILDCTCNLSISCNYASGYCG